MKDVCFSVEIDSYNEIDVEVEVTEEEYPILCRFADEMSVEYSDCGDLADLYRWVRDAARKFLKENFKVTPEWPELTD